MNSEIEIELTPAAEGTADRQVDALYRRYRDPLYAYLLVLLRDPEAAEDLLQEVFLKLMRTGKTLSKVENVRSYVYRMCRNQAIDFIRSNKRAPPTAGSIDAFQLVERAEGASRHCPHDAEAINRALQLLDREQYEIVAMKVYQGLTFREIAEVVGVPQKTCESRYAYGLKHLAELLGPHHPRKEP